MMVPSCPNCSETRQFNSTEQDFYCFVCGYESDDLERDFYTARFRENMSKVVKLARGDKTTGYGEAWKRTGLMGVYIKLMIKESRLRRLVWESGGELTSKRDEDIKDTLRDMMAYANYGLMCLEEGNMQGDITSEDKLEMIKEELENGNRAD